MPEPEHRCHDLFAPPPRMHPRLQSVGNANSNRFLAAEADRPTARQANEAPGDSRRTGLDAGWLISRKPIDSSSRTDSQTAVNSQTAMSANQPPQCLQLATGQWRPPSQATWFPAPGAAIFYAADLGREAGQTIEIIFLQREPA